ncbi:hypothetical protein MRS44_008252 [Fusarium solani]|uniref:uncharacterized protein n=1 Tax=Fusarium solani TaxID=169388 RepID=UPI0032C46291|nr:hypothetical protein MRS44_008252 [Fusarium solani]
MTSTTSRYAAAHLKPNGPGDARPTALQIVKDEQREGSLADKVVLITGCSSGLGIETARAMKATGATIFVTARNLEKARTALEDVLDHIQVHLLKLDLESFESVRACVAELKAKTNKLNILIENAGIRHVPEGRTKDGFELHWGTNHLSHFLLFELLRPMLLESSTPDFQSRAVISKLANVYTASEIERRYGAQGLHAWSVHPGGIRTGLQKPNLHDALIFFKSGVMATLKSMMSPEQGASTSVWAAVSRELEGRGGKYLERNRISEPRKGESVIEAGHAEWAYDEEKAKRLYDISLTSVQ